MAQKSWQELIASDHWSGAGFEQLPKEQIKARLPSILLLTLALKLKIKDREERSLIMQAG